LFQKNVKIWYKQLGRIWQKLETIRKKGMRKIQKKLTKNKVRLLSTWSLSVKLMNFCVMWKFTCSVMVFCLVLSITVIKLFFFLLLPWWNAFHWFNALS